MHEGFWTREVSVSHCAEPLCESELSTRRGQCMLRPGVPFRLEQGTVGILISYIVVWHKRARHRSLMV